MKKILLNPDIPERELKLVNSNFSRILLSILDQKQFIKKKYNVNKSNYVYGLTVEGQVVIDFIDEFFLLLGYKPYDDKELNENDLESKNDFTF